MTHVRTRPRRLPPDEVRALLGEPESMLENKKIDHIDAFARRFIAHSPFASLATADAAGRADCSPRGDYPGFVKVLDERTLAIPDRPGNRIADSFRNIAENPEVGLLFLVPGMPETLRVNGRAYPTDEPDVLARMRTEAKAPVLAIVVEVTEAFFHCGRALLRSRLWDPASRALADELPSVGEIAAAQFGADIDPQHFEAVLEESYRKLF
ncbi:pyridoxamine 5'-phosphate oxidase family protein [Streptomyces albofaciens JCM 4342]|uniref:MSMEG_1061 family FMN-dependent PPOX-type flavoprotein n=1 Tax=Streptomyces albofaciens TaxID=66866 RepID=UPI00123C0484|nr:MSMEG_1061 family FMN-dependent PPOX-type flavoprotein [Streptomyces albofaciens]KAA6213094.1 pyridoxamine 5'-phosphate oxidase family protein [Streptomyces albofaciens JCM 4342]